MSKFTALITALILGSSSIAIASPSSSTATFSASATWSAQTGWTSGPAVRDHRDRTPRRPFAGSKYDNSYDRPMAIQSSQPMRPMYGWNATALGLDTGFDHAGRAHITVGARAGAYRNITISAANGNIVVNRVLVQFTDGRRQLLEGLSLNLSGNRTFTLDLMGNMQTIDYVVVYGASVYNPYSYNRSIGTVALAGF